MSDKELIRDQHSHVWWALRAAHRLARYEVTRAETEIASKKVQIVSRGDELRVLETQLKNARITENEIAEFAARSGWRLDMEYDEAKDAAADAADEPRDAR